MSANFFNDWEKYVKDEESNSTPTEVSEETPEQVARRVFSSEIEKMKEELNEQFGKAVQGALSQLNQESVGGECNG